MRTSSGFVLFAILDAYAKPWLFEVSNDADRVQLPMSVSTACRVAENALSSLPIQGSKLPMPDSKPDGWCGGALGESLVTTDAKPPSCQAVKQVRSTARSKTVRFKISSDDGYDAKSQPRGAQVMNPRKTRPFKTSSTSSVGR